MRDTNRLYPFYSELTRVHITYFPDWRFGQFISNFFGWIARKGKDPFFIEESKMLDFLHEYVGEI